MIIEECEQLSEEWFQKKLGKPSASHYSLIITTHGKPSASAKNYAYKLVYERITGNRAETYMSYDMKRGMENEPIARALYEFIEGVEVRTVGLCYFDEHKKFLSSPDGLIGDNGGLEIKDAKPGIQIDRLLNGWNKADHFQQIQGNMFVTQRDWWDRMSHCPGLPPVIDRYYRDNKFFAALKVELESFCAELDRIEDEVRGRI